MGLTIQGGEINGTTVVNGYTVPIDLALSSRTGNEPAEYVASITVEFTGEFSSGETDEFTAYITDATYAGTGNQTSGGQYGTAGNYRYGFNGKEMDNEVKGVGNSVAYENRIYDPRIGRWYSLDPLQMKYPGEGHYNFVSGNPILYADKAGLDKVVTITVIGKDGKSTVHQIRDAKYFRYVAQYQNYSLPDMPGKRFLKGEKQNVYENIVIDLANPRNSSSSTKYQTVESFNTMVSYYGSMAAAAIGDFATADDLSYKSKVGTVLFGNRQNGEDDLKNMKAAPGSDVLDLKQILPLLEGFKDIYGESGVSIEAMSPGDLKKLLNILDNSAKAYEKSKDANGGNDWLPMKKDMPASNEFKDESTITVILPSKKGSRSDTAVWLFDPADKKKPDALFKQPYTKVK